MIATNPNPGSQSGSYDNERLPTGPSLSSMDKHYASTRPLSEREACQRLGLSQRTLQDWRRRSCGPAFLKLGKRVAYRPADLDAYEESCRVQPKGAIGGGE